MGSPYKFLFLESIRSKISSLTIYKFGKLSPKATFCLWLITGMAFMFSSLQASRSASEYCVYFIISSGFGGLKNGWRSFGILSEPSTMSVSGIRFLSMATRWMCWVETVRENFNYFTFMANFKSASFNLLLWIFCSGVIFWFNSLSLTRYYLFIWLSWTISVV